MNKHIIDLIENKFGEFIVFSTRLSPHTILYIKDKKIIHKDTFYKPVQEEVNIMLDKLNKPKWDMKINQDKVEEVVVDEDGFWQFTLRGFN